MSIILFIIIMLSLIFFLKKGYVGIAGSAVYRDKNPILYWSQLILFFIADICLLFLIIFDYV